MKKRHNAKGQASSFEYAVTFAIVTAIVTAMTVYFKRAVQARFADAIQYTEDEMTGFLSGSGANIVGNFVAQYEPYYTRSVVEKDSRGAVVDRENGGIGVGSIQKKEYQGFETIMRATSNQLAPKDAY